MDWEKGLIAAILRTGFDVYAESALPEDALSPQAAQVMRFIEKSYTEHGKTLDFATVEYMTETTFRDAPEEPIEFWRAHLKGRHMFRVVKNACEAALEKNAVDPLSAVSMLQEMILNLEQNAPMAAKLIPIFNAEIWELAIAKIEAGDMGIATPWPSLTERTGGWKPQDLIVIAARPGLGKTFCWLMMLIHAWQQGKRVLAVTTEMSTEAIVMRATSTTTKTSYGRARKGRLLSYEKSFIREQLNAARDDGSRDRLVVMGDGFDVYLENIETKIQSFKPDLLAIDGAYLMRSRAVNEKDRFNRIAELFNQFKAIAKRHNVPVIITTQLNRGNGAKGPGVKRGLDRLAFSDNVAMVADFILFLNQEDDDKRDKRMIIEIGKLREGDDYTDLGINWDFENQNFSELPADGSWKTPSPAPAPASPTVKKTYQSKSSWGAGRPGVD